MHSAGLSSEVALRLRRCRCGSLIQLTVTDELRIPISGCAEAGWIRIPDGCIASTRHVDFSLEWPSPKPCVEA